MNILVVRNDKLGDFITALPTFYVLKQHNPENRIIALVALLNRKLAESCDFIDEVIVDESPDILELAFKIKKARIDASITLFSNTRVALAQFIARIPLRIAPATKIAQIFYNRRIRQRRSEVKMAEFEYNLELTKALFPDITLDFPKPLLQLEGSAEAYRAFCSEYGVDKPVIAFHPGFGGSSDANWTLAEYTLLVRLAEADERFDVVMTFGPDEEKLYDEAKELLGESRVILYRSRGSVVDFAKLLSSFKLFISTSTGTYHLASAVGCETFTFFADTLFASASRWKSIGEQQRHFMIPLDSTGRAAMFETVKQELKNRLLTLS
ncbi:MAG: heptosyltransferase [Sulfuricurvum sp. GWF2_44_89]|uniref:glycosyltransferase family 9 protein n=1 Tax=unclassified Sulfuricurvum TaxID=2632390 RepID=UPI0008C9B732|nr:MULTISPECIES: glycosyltransferase family 9 protein [unclassified Sulfuricurvum]OHD78143.1 MAG: heptosyltransferase [Sulfuricurvum sp. GWF2_44_89]OHD91477.1 MAG: heptosyltransferase [Sulfuricurvum sp. RIFOXYD12_FULL_44_77]OHD92608.1 MAG: heptosyltransferase [Sulfuricurvum sp. RIFOXYD2_FULL_44_160]